LIAFTSPIQQIPLRVREWKCRIEPLERRVLCASIAVNLSQTYQTIAGMGGNYARAKYGDFFIESNDKVGQYTLNNLQPKHARIGIPLRGWEASNDDAIPTSMNMVGFATTNSTVDGVFKLMQDLNGRGISVTASVWDAPNWMISNPTATRNRVVPQTLWPELVESIAAFLKRARDTFGVSVDYLSFNESDGGSNLKFSATDQAAFIAQAGPKFAQLGVGYTPKWLVGDTGNAQRLVAYATPILNNPGAAPYLGPIAFHGWDSLTYADSVFTGIAALGQQYNKPIWCEEVGYDALAFNQTPAPFPTWSYAINTAQVYYKVLKLAGATVGDYWEFQNDYPLLTNSSTPTLYPAYHVINTIMQNFTPGTQMIAADSDTGGVLSMGGMDGRSGRISVQAINTVSTSQSVTITGLPEGMTVGLVRSSATENSVSAGTFTVSGGSITLSLPASSVCMLSGIRPTTVRPPVRGPSPSPSPAPPPTDPTPAPTLPTDLQPTRLTLRSEQILLLSRLSFMPRLSRMWRTLSLTAL
jgi:O-glycosyl hydrolase